MFTLKKETTRSQAELETLIIVWNITPWPPTFIRMACVDDDKMMMSFTDVYAEVIDSDLGPWCGAHARRVVV